MKLRQKVSFAVALIIVAIPFISSLLFYFFGFPFVSGLSLVFMIAGVFVVLLQVLSFDKIDFKNKKFIVMHGWLYPKEFKSLPFDGIRQLSIARGSSGSKHLFLFLDLEDGTSIELLGDRSFGPLKARAEKIAGLMDKPLVYETAVTEPARKMSKFPNDSTIQTYLIMGYPFAAFPLFLVLALAGTIWCLARERREAPTRAAEALYARYQPVIDEAEKIKDDCEVLQDGYLSGKIAVRLPADKPFKEDWRAVLPERYLPGSIQTVNTVILIDTFEHDWGTSSGTIVLLKERKKFRFYASSGRKEKRLGSTIRAEGPLSTYLDELPSEGAERFTGPAAKRE